jgi:hypothetical protein
MRCSATIKREWYVCKYYVHNNYLVYVNISELNKINTLESCFLRNII